MRSQTILPVLTLSIVVCLAVSLVTEAGAPTSNEIPLTGHSCDRLNPPEISYEAWLDVEGNLWQTNHNTVQRASDLFSWQTFLALNWPAGTERGEPDKSALITDSGPRVWETWKETFEIYRPDGHRPDPWNAPEPIPAACGAQACGGVGEPPCASVTKHRLRTTKVSDVVDEITQALPADGTLLPTLKDQQGRLVRYEVRLNKTLFDYIANPDAKLYNGTEQAKATKIEFPAGSQLIKAAWRQIDKAEKPAFYATEACVCDEVSVDESTNCRPMTMGLAGLHIMTKTKSAPQWIWSTFEHVDNIDTTHGAVKPLNDPHCPPDLCPPNKQTDPYVPTQVRREVPIPSQEPDCLRPDQAIDNVVRLNSDVQKALRDRDSKLQFYQLVGTQWPVPSRDPVDTARSPAVTTDSPNTVFEVMPALLANTTMETFSQDTSSCMGCHAMARTSNPSAFVSADFSFTLNNALPRPSDAVCDTVEGSESCGNSIILPPEAPKTPWDRANWPEILAGYAFATRTYELTAPRYVGSKLHCSSCHLNGGGNRDAAWWVNMHKLYEYPETTHLQDRINQCFERSMNGVAVCSTADGSKDCDENPVMRSLITYMEWIDRRFQVLYPNRQPCRGFPPFSAGDGDYDRGHRIYTQKCSFCHNDEGQGRYESDTYFRPALWGSHSFDACAGMGKVEKLGAFLRWNMPYTSGGLLTSQEATDLATYIDAQCRPGKERLPNGELCALSRSCVNGEPVEPSSGWKPDPPPVCPEFTMMRGKR